MPPTRSQSDPTVPPAMVHTLPPQTPPVPPASPVPPAAVNPSAPPAPPTPPETAEADAAEPQIMSLHLMDQEIAEEADRLLQSETGAGDDQLIDATPDQAPDDALEEMTQPIEQSADDEINEQVVEPIAVAAEAAPPAESVPELQPALEPELQQETGSKPEPAVAAPAEPAASSQPKPELEEAAVAKVQQKVAPATSNDPAFFSRSLQTAMAAAVAVLVFMNYPTRLLPESAKTIFNWFAFSLLLWVPAVWFIAVFVVGR